MVLIVDKLLISGIRWALDKVVNAVDAEMNNEDVLREELLAAQMRYELGEISEDEFAENEANVLAALREIQDRKRGSGGPRQALGGKGTKISSVDISFGGDEDEEVTLGAGRDDEEEQEPHEPQALIEVDAASRILEEREESHLAIEAADVEAPVLPESRARRAAKKTKTKTKMNPKAKKKTTAKRRS